MVHFDCSGLEVSFTIAAAYCVSALSFNVIITDVVIAIDYDNSDHQWFESWLETSECQEDTPSARQTFPVDAIH